jgi:hypothetical protein
VRRKRILITIIKTSGADPDPTLLSVPNPAPKVIKLELKVLSNGEGGGPKLVSIDPFW